MAAQQLGVAGGQFAGRVSGNITNFAKGMATGRIGPLSGIRNRIMAVKEGWEASREALKRRRLAPFREMGIRAAEKVAGVGAKYREMPRRVLLGKSAEDFKKEAERKREEARRLREEAQDMSKPLTPIERDRLMAKADRLDKSANWEERKARIAHWIAPTFKGAKIEPDLMKANKLEVEAMELEKRIKEGGDLWEKSKIAQEKLNEAKVRGDEKAVKAAQKEVSRVQESINDIKRRVNNKRKEAARIRYGIPGIPTVEEAKKQADILEREIEKIRNIDLKQAIKEYEDVKKRENPESKLNHLINVQKKHQTEKPSEKDPHYSDWKREDDELKRKIENLQAAITSGKAEKEYKEKIKPYLNRIEDIEREIDERNKVLDILRKSASTREKIIEKITPTGKYALDYLKHADYDRILTMVKRLPKDPDKLARMIKNPENNDQAAAASLKLLKYYKGEREKPGGGEVGDLSFADFFKKKIGITLNNAALKYNFHPDVQKDLDIKINSAIQAEAGIKALMDSLQKQGISFRDITTEIEDSLEKIDFAKLRTDLDNLAKRINNLIKDKKIVSWQQRQSAQSIINRINNLKSLSEKPEAEDENTDEGKKIRVEINDLLSSLK